MAQASMTRVASSARWSSAVPSGDRQGEQPLVEEVDVVLPREADAAEHLDRGAAELRERLARERLRHRRGAVRLFGGGVVAGPARVVPRPRGRARPCAACRRTGAARPGTSRSACRTAPAPWRTRPRARAARAAAPTPSTTYAAREPVERFAPPRRSRRPSPSRRPRRRRASTVRLLAGPVDRRRRFDDDRAVALGPVCTANTPSVAVVVARGHEQQRRGRAVGDVHLRARRGASRRRRGRAVVAGVATRSGVSGS